MEFTSVKKEANKVWKKEMETAEGMKQLVQNSSFSKWVSLFNLNDSMAVPLNAWKPRKKKRRVLILAPSAIFFIS